MFKYFIIVFFKNAEDYIEGKISSVVQTGKSRYEALKILELSHPDSTIIKCFKYDFLIK